MEKETQRICLTVEELADALGIGLTNAYKLVKDKKFFPAKKICGRYLISINQLNEWLAQQEK